jgi:hypothetical protein
MVNIGLKAIAVFLPTNQNKLKRYMQDTDVITQISDFLRLYYQTQDPTYINHIMDLCIKNSRYADIGFALATVAEDIPNLTAEQKTERMRKVETKLTNLCMIRRNVLKHLVEKNKEKTKVFNSYLM